MPDEKRERPAGDEYRDPLENYDPKSYGDPLERALAEETVEAIQARPFVSFSPDTPIDEILARMVALKIACVLVDENGKLVGIFSERDVLNKIALEFEHVRHRPVREFMTPHPLCVYSTDKSAAPLSVMAVTGYRHVPVVDLNDQLVGVVGPQRVMTFLQSYFESPLA